jgi:RNA polymerase sigma factor (sigma-70 family)
MDPPSDRDLAVRARRGDAAAYGELVERYQTSGFNVCYRMMGNRQEAEDMSQESFLRGYDRLATFDPARPFGPWIRRVAANYCLNRLFALRSHAEPLHRGGLALRSAVHSVSKEGSHHTEWMRSPARHS